MKLPALIKGKCTQNIFPSTIGTEAAKPPHAKRYAFGERTPHSSWALIFCFLPTLFRSRDGLEAAQCCGVAAEQHESVGVCLDFQEVLISNPLLPIKMWIPFGNLLSSGLVRGVLASAESKDRT